MRTLSTLILGLLLLAGCNDDRVVAPHAASPPAAPRGLQSITATSYVVSGLANGQTRYFAVSAVDAGGAESELSYDTIFDTPRPEGFGLALANYRSDSLEAGYDFSGYAIRSYTSPSVDIFYGSSGGQALMIAPFADTEIQDAGYGSTLDAVDYAPPAGWSPTGTVELITGHCYVVWTHDNHYAKFRVTSVTPARVVVDWAYQVAAGNTELKARPDGEHATPRRLRAGVPELLKSPGAA